MIRIDRFRLLPLATLICAGTALASPVEYSYNTVVQFNPDQTVGAGGQNAGALVDELFGAGIGSGGSAQLSGSFTYETNTTQSNGNANTASYADAITATSVRLGSTTAQADLNVINANRGSSGVGYNASGNSSCFNSGCDNSVLSLIPEGNHVAVLNDTPFTYYGPNGELEFSTRDDLDFAIGATAADEDFSPAITTEAFGDLYVDSVFLNLMANPSEGFFDSNALPDNFGFLDSTALESSIFSINFSGPELENGFSLNGTLSDLNEGGMMPPLDGGSAAAVPEPGSWAMLAVGLALVGIGTVKRDKGCALK